MGRTLGIGLAALSALGGCGDDCARRWFRDFDGDGFGDPGTSVRDCAPPDDGAGWVTDGRDCDDERATTHPDAADLCNGVDDDCDGAIDPAGTVWYPDADGDGWGVAAVGFAACAAPDGYVDQPGDCDDARGEAYPGAPERCNDLDDDCDRTVDEGAPPVDGWFEDVDGDGYGGAEARLCAVPAGQRYARIGGDCDDGRADVSPAALEDCDLGVDDDCDGLADDDDPEGTLGQVAHWADLDRDGYGDDATLTLRCPDPGDDAWTRLAGDCDDGDPTVSPAAAETCGAGDEDCDGLRDEADPDLDEAGGGFPRWADLDGDGHGGPTSGVRCAAVEPGWADRDGDCDDLDPRVGDDRWWTEDADGDGAGAGGITAGTSCAPPVPGLPNVATADCDDLDPLARPGVPDVCDDGLDADCSGQDRPCGALASGVLRASTTARGALPALSVGFDAGDLDGDGLTDLVVGGDGALRVAYGPPPEVPGPLVATLGLPGAFGPTALALDLGASGVVALAVDTAGGVVRGFSLAGRQLVELAQAPVSPGSALLPAHLPAGPGGAQRFLAADDAELAVLELAPGGGFTREATLTRAGPGGARAGGDPDADGAIDLAVGEKPTARVFLLPAETVGAHAVDAVAHTVVTGTPGSQFGAAVAWVDWDDDGVSDLVVGAPDEDLTGTDAGAVYVFSAPTGAVDASDAILAIFGSTPGDRFGSALEVVDLDGDGLPELIAAAPESAVGNPGSGAVAGFPHGAVGVTDALSAAVVWYGEVQAALGARTGVVDLDDQGGADLLLTDVSTVWWLPGR